MYKYYLTKFIRSLETKRKLESQLEQNISEIAQLRRENAISQQEYQEKLQEANNKTAENYEKLEYELGKLKEQVITGAAKVKGLFTRIGETLDKVFGWPYSKNV